MRTQFHFAAVLLLIAIQITAQEKWTCYTDKSELLVDTQIILGVFEYTDGAMWMVTDRGINTFKDGVWNTINKKTDLLKNQIGSYMVDSQNNIWVGSGSPDIFFDGYALGQLYEGGVVIYDGKEWKARNTKEMGIKSAVVTKMFETSGGDFWLGVSSVKPGAESTGLFAKGALLHYSKATGEWTDYRQKDVPCFNCHFVKDFFEDQNGRVHFIVDNGIYYFEKDRFHYVNKEDKTFKFMGKGAIITKLEDSKNQLWLGIPGWVARYDGNTWRSFNRKNGLTVKNGYPYGFVETADNTIIMSAVNGLYTFDGEEQWVQEKMNFLTGNSFVDTQNRLWIPTQKGLIVRDAENESLYENIPKASYLFEDKHGGIWALSRNKGAWRFREGKWQQFNKENQLPSDRVGMTYVSNNGTVWLTTNKGICSCEYN